MAEEVKPMIIYHPWSSLCSNQIELGVQKTLKVIRCSFLDELKNIQIFPEIGTPSYYDRSLGSLKTTTIPVWVQALCESTGAFYKDKVGAEKVT